MSRPLGWYWTANLGSLCPVVDLLCMLDFLWQSSIVSPNSDLKNLIFAASMFWTFLLFMIQVLLQSYF